MSELHPVCVCVWAVIEFPIRSSVVGTLKHTSENPDMCFQQALTDVADFKQEVELRMSSSDVL